MNLHLSPEKMTQRIMMDAIEMGSEYEPEVCNFMRTVLTPGSNFVDVGAHVGFFTCLGAELVQNGYVYSFEPEKDNYSDLLANIESNGYANVKTFNNAVGNKNEEIELFFNRDNDGGHSLWDPAKHPFNTRTAKNERSKQSVKMVTLDSVIDFVPKLIKIDVEGCELMVLEGAERLIKEYQPSIVLEINDMALQEMDTNRQKIESYIKSFDYLCFMLATGERVDLVAHKNISRMVYNVAFLSMRKQ